MGNLLCPLLAPQLERVSVAQDCRKEKCAWYLKLDKGFGGSSCAILKIATALLRK